VQADFSVELGADDEILDLPWSDESGRLQYHDLKRNPKELAQIEEAQRESALGEFLSAINSPGSIFETAKCDAWASNEMDVEDEIFASTHKFGSYVDIVFFDEQTRLQFEIHEEFAKKLCALLKKAPDTQTSAEFLIRRCYFDQSHQQGFYFTFYLFGYANDACQAHQRWVIGLKLVENAIRQASR
jgi:hypothetical protein